MSFETAPSDESTIEATTDNVQETTAPEIEAAVNDAAEATDAVSAAAETVSETAELVEENAAQTAEEAAPVSEPEEATPATEPEEAAAEAPAAEVDAATEASPAESAAAEEAVEQNAAEASEEAGDLAAAATGVADQSAPVATEGAGESVAAATEESDESAKAQQDGPHALDLESIRRRTTTLETDLETAEHKVSLNSRLTVLQEGLDNLEPSEERAELDARLAAVQSAIAAQGLERAAAKDVIVTKAEALVESTEWKATSEAFRTMQEELRAVGAAGKELDDPLWERFRAARAAFHERRTAFFAERQKAWEESKTKKEALAAEAEALAVVDDFKDKSSRARSMMDDWKAAGFAGREAEDELWPRFRGALDKFYERRGAYYEENKAKKEALVTQAEDIAESTDWKTTAEALRRLMEEWKTLGSAGREHDDPLWTRFRGAQQKFYDGRSSAFAERETAHKENIRIKEDLCEQAESIALREDMRGAIQDVIALQSSWKTVGFIPREKSDELWQRFKRACDAVFSHVDTDRQDRQKTREQGLQDAVSRKREQYQRLNESIAHDQANINRWRDTISSLGGGGRADQIRDELENRVIEVLDRVRAKQQRAEELQADLHGMETQA